MIQVTDVSFQYPNGFTILEHISFQINRGEFVALIGQNGAGKTTLLKQFNGLLKPTSGNILIDQVNTKDSSTGELARKVGYLFQNPDHQIFLPTVEKEIGFGPANLHLSKDEVKERVREAAAEVGLTQYLNENPLFLSKGQRQRVAFASLLSMQPEVMVLDEPTTGQDYQEGIEIMEMVKELHQKGHTIVFVTHDMELVAEYAQRVIVLSEGRILIDDVCRKVFYQPELLKQTNLFPSQIARLVQKFPDYSKRFGQALTVRELYEQVLKMTESDFRCLL
ncbi:MAG TPA: energy-coupling factor ABC transporter ATP-binding protein [Firmicutes bacterium]|jgi:energy-coupling factor transport system ATP-binding protein|nr:energy-coupling factor ABC transporter ATP-binding protein [Bacillota bacterium]